MFLVLRKHLHVYIRIIIKIYIYHTIFTNFTYINKNNSTHQSQNTDKGGKFAHTPPFILSSQYKISPLLFKKRLKHKLLLKCICLNMLRNWGLQTRNRVLTEKHMHNFKANFLTNKKNLQEACHKFSQQNVLIIFFSEGFLHSPIHSSKAIVLSSHCQKVMENEGRR